MILQFCRQVTFLLIYHYLTSFSFLFCSNHLYGRIASFHLLSCYLSFIIFSFPLFSSIHSYHMKVLKILLLTFPLVVAIVLLALYVVTGGTYAINLMILRRGNEMILTRKKEEINNHYDYSRKWRKLLPLLWITLYWSIFLFFSYSSLSMLYSLLLMFISILCTICSLLFMFISLLFIICSLLFMLISLLFIICSSLFILIQLLLLFRHRWLYIFYYKEWGEL